MKNQESKFIELVKEREQFKRSLNEVIKISNNRLIKIIDLEKQIKELKKQLL